MSSVSKLELFHHNNTTNIGYSATSQHFDETTMRLPSTDLSLKSTIASRRKSSEYHNECTSPSTPTNLRPGKIITTTKSGGTTMGKARKSNDNSSSSSSSSSTVTFVTAKRIKTPATPTKCSTNDSSQIKNGSSSQKPARRTAQSALMARSSSGIASNNESVVGSGANTSHNKSPTNEIAVKINRPEDDEGDEDLRHEPAINSQLINPSPTPNIQSALVNDVTELEPPAYSPRRPAQLLTIETRSGVSNSNTSVQERHLEKLTQLPFGHVRNEICQNCTAFDEAVASSQRDAVYSDQETWRNLQFVIREKYTTFAKLEAISRIQEKIQDLVGFIDSSVLTNSSWSTSKDHQHSNSGATSRHHLPATSPSSTKELPDDLNIMMKHFTSDIEASNALSSWLLDSVHSTVLHLENAAKFYQFESELGQCCTWMVKSVEAASAKLDELARNGFCDWETITSCSDDQGVSSASAASLWLSRSFQEIESCMGLLYFWQEKVERVVATSHRLSPVYKRSPTQRGVYTPNTVDMFTNTSSPSSILLSPTRNGSTNNLMPARLLLDYPSKKGILNRSSTVNITHMNSARAVKLPNYWQVEIPNENGNPTNAIKPSYDIPNYACELIPTAAELQERQDLVSEVATNFVSSGYKLLKSLNNFIIEFLRANFPPLDEGKENLLMGLELSDKLDSLNVIHETIEFIEKIISDDDERVDILNTLMGYKNALLSERKTNVDITNDGHHGSMVVVNVELLKQLIAKVNQVGNDWDAFAERVDKVQFDDSEVKPFRPLNENFASWYKLIDLEASSNQMESTPRMISVGLDASVQTDEKDTATKAEVGSLTVGNGMETMERATSDSLSDNGDYSDSQSVDSDLMVQSEVAEERRRFTIIGVVKSNCDQDDLMSWHDAIAMGIVDPSAGTCLDLAAPKPVAIPIPTAIQQGLIVVEHQSEAEVLRREQKTEHVISRNGSKRFNSRPNLHLNGHLVPDEPMTESPKSNGTTIVIRDSDSPCPAEQNLPPPSYSSSFQPSRHLNSMSSSDESANEHFHKVSHGNYVGRHAEKNRAASSSPPRIPDMNGNASKPINGSLRLHANVKPVATTISNGSRPTAAKAILINRDKLSNTKISTSNGHQQNMAANGHNGEPTYVAEALLEDGEGADGLITNKTKTSLSLISKQLEQKLAPSFNRRVEQLKEYNRSKANGIEGLEKSSNNKKTVPLKNRPLVLDSGNKTSPMTSPLPKAPVRSQVGARGSVRKMAKLFEQR